MAKLLFFLLSLPAFAVQAPSADLQYFSVCGTYDANTRELQLKNGEKVDILPSGQAPESSGEFCFRGPDLQHFEKDSAWWEFAPKGFSAVIGELKYPVLVCAVLDAEAFRTDWAGTPLTFRGPFPKRKKEYGWCADGVSLPSREKKKWFFNAERFREMPDPGFRSGMSIGNQ